MSARFTPKVVTGNALLEGDVIYLTRADDWTRHLAQAEVIDDEAHAQLRLLDGQRQSDVAVGVYLAEVAKSPLGPEPTHLREEFRRRGPSNRAHGKQETAPPDPGPT